ncbi:hypothetical protein STXM2123_5358 [Streptomyces sp. F-3]|nr:hypothetical protein STXM2123_5358 [Streptomyces sp. F-3]
MRLGEVVEGAGGKRAGGGRLGGAGENRSVVVHVRHVSRAGPGL